MGEQSEVTLSNRKVIRLRGYDYSQAGYYFITICVDGKRNLLGKIVHDHLNDDMHSPVGAATCRPLTELSWIGHIADVAIAKIPQIHPGVKIDKYVIMPNHIHMILIIEGTARRQIAAPTVSVQTVIGGMKRAVTIQTSLPVWQKSFHDHVIRDNADYQSIWKYIDENPIKWITDRYFAE